MSFVLDHAALARLMPMHLVLDAAGIVLSAGATVARIAEIGPGDRFFDRFDLRHGAGLSSVADLLAAGGRLQVQGRARPDLAFRAVAVAMGEGALVNLSFGIGVVEAVRRHALTEADFAPTDLTVELLYLYEAKTAVLEELRGLNRRLLGDKVMAEEKAVTDALTGLRNRRGLDLALDEQRGSDFALVHLDLDRFKAVNDSLGHAAGDHVLAEVGRRLVAESRRQDTVARVGGDEFILLLPGLERPEVALSRVERMIARVSMPILWEGQRCEVGASAGLVLTSLSPGVADDVLIARADEALYAAKRAGRGQVLLWERRLTQGGA